LGGKRRHYAETTGIRPSTMMMMMTTMMKAPKCDNEFDFLEERMKAKRRKRNQMKRPVKGRREGISSAVSMGTVIRSSLPPSFLCATLRCVAMRCVPRSQSQFPSPTPSRHIGFSRTRGDRKREQEPVWLGKPTKP